LDSKGVALGYAEVALQATGWCLTLVGNCD